MDNSVNERPADPVPPISVSRRDALATLGGGVLATARAPYVVPSVAALGLLDLTTFGMSGRPKDKKKKKKDKKR